MFLPEDEQLSSGYLVFSVVHQRRYNMRKSMTYKSHRCKLVYDGEVGHAVIEPDRNGNAELRTARELWGDIFEKSSDNCVGVVDYFSKFLLAWLLATDWLTEERFTGDNGRGGEFP